MFFQLTPNISNRISLKVASDAYYKTKKMYDSVDSNKTTLQPRPIDAEVCNLPVGSRPLARNFKRGSIQGKGGCSYKPLDPPSSWLRVWAYFFYQKFNEENSIRDMQMTCTCYMEQTRWIPVKKPITFVLATEWRQWPSRCLQVWTPWTKEVTDLKVSPSRQLYWLMSRTNKISR